MCSMAVFEEDQSSFVLCLRCSSQIRPMLRFGIAFSKNNIPSNPVNSRNFLNSHIRYNPQVATVEQELVDNPKNLPNLYDHHHLHIWDILLFTKGAVFMGEFMQTDEFDIDSFLSVDVRAFTDALASLERRIPAGQIPQDDEFLRELTVAFHRSRDACEAAEIAIGANTELLKEMQSKFRDAIAPWFDQSWFMQRAKVKPRGYPGDYLMLSSIYDGETKSTGIGGYLDLYFLNTDLARGVCTRLANVKQFIQEEAASRSARFSVLNVACGPGREYTHDFVAPEGMTLTCVDSDDTALEYLRENVSAENASSLDLNCVNYNALKMTSSQKNIERFGEVDMIYSVGLCDYIPDRYMIRMLNGWRETVGENGVVYVAFKDFLKYYPAEYQWHVDWYFYQRTEGDCRKLFADAGYNVDEMEMFRDSSGVIMNFIAREPAIARNRFHAAEGLRGPHIPNVNSELSEEDVELTEG